MSQFVQSFMLEILSTEKRIHFLNSVSKERKFETLFITEVTLKSKYLSWLRLREICRSPILPCSELYILYSVHVQQSTIHLYVISYECYHRYIPCRCHQCLMTTRFIWSDESRNSLVALFCHNFQSF